MSHLAYRIGVGMRMHQDDKLHGWYDLSYPRVFDSSAITKGGVRQLWFVGLSKHGEGTLVNNDINDQKDSVTGKLKKKKMHQSKRLRN